MDLIEIQDRLEQATVRMDQIVLLAGMLAFEDPLADPLCELLEEDPDILRRCFPDMPEALAEVEDSRAFKELFVEWAYRDKKFGFAVQFARPVFKWNTPTSAAFSWGRYNTQWLYADTLDAVVERGLAWAAEREAAEKAKL